MLLQNHSYNHTVQMSARAVGIALIVLSIISTIKMGWVGYLASDDNAYIARAEEWLSGSYPPPKNHWATRHTLTLPIAASYFSLGSGEIESILPSLVFGIVLILIISTAIAFQFGWSSSLLCALMLTTNPLTVELMTTANVDVVETFFVACSLICFCGAIRGKSALWLYSAGILAGLAMESRETSIAMAFFYAALFLFRPLMPRWRYGILILGFSTIVLGEMLYFYELYDKPLLRYEIASYAVRAVDPFEKGTGNIITGWFAPPATLLINNEFGLLFWAVIPATWYFLVNKPLLNSIQLNVIRLIIFLAMLWFFLIQYGFGLMPLPRYFFVVATVGCVLVSVWMDYLISSGHAVRGCLLFGLIISSNILLIDLSNQQLLLPERELVRLAHSDSRELHTDPRTKWRAERVLQWSGIKPEDISIEPPGPGSLFLYSEEAVTRGDAGPNGKFNPDLYRPGHNWKKVYETRGSPTMIGRAMRTVGLEGHLARLGLGRVIWETSPVVVYLIKNDQGSDNRDRSSKTPSIRSDGTLSCGPDCK